MKRSLALLAALLILTACSDPTADDEETPEPDAPQASETTKTSDAPQASEMAAEPEAPETPNSPQAFIDRLDAALTGSDQVLHINVTAGGEEPGQARQELWTDEIWIDGAAASAHQLFRRAPENNAELDDEAHYITVGEQSYSNSGGAETEIRNGPPARTCPLVDTPPMVDVVAGLFCARYVPQEGEVGELDARVEAAEFDGQPAMALIYETGNDLSADATPQPEGLPSKILSTLYIERESGLPLGWRVEYFEPDDTLRATIEGHYVNEHIARDELPADYFSPAALIEPPPTVPLYWLGGSFDPDGDLPLIQPNEITAPQGPEGQPTGPTYQALLSYAAPFTEPWINEIHIQEWAVDDWTAALDSGLIASELWLYPCAEVRALDIEQGTATMYETFEPQPTGPLRGTAGDCPDDEHDRFIGVVELGDTVLLINGPFGDQLHPRSLGAEQPGPDKDDPYDTLAGLEALIRGLQPLPGAQPAPGSSSDEPVASEAPTIEVIYAGLAATLQGEARVLHLTQQVESEVTGFYQGASTIQYWVDVREPAARTEVAGTFEFVEEGRVMEGRSHVVIRDGAQYVTDEGDFGQDEPRAVVAAGCYGQPEAIAVIIGCPGPTETSTTAVEWGDFEGERALVLVTEGESRGSDEVQTFTRRTYLDPDTLLPIFAEEEGVYATGTEYPSAATFAYTHEFVEGTSLPDDFFDPASIGYTEPDHSTMLDEYFDTPVYWLGERFEAGGGLPALVLSNVIDDSDVPPHIANYDGTIHYAPADNPHGPGAIGMQLWSAEAWDSSGGESFTAGMGSRPCIAEEHIQLDGGEATLYRWFEGNAGAPGVPTPSTAPDDDCVEFEGGERFMAVVRFPETVLLIDAPGSSSPRDGYHPSPYNSAAGMRAVVEKLEMRD